MALYDFENNAMTLDRIPGAIGFIPGQASFYRNPTKLLNGVNSYKRFMLHLPLLRNYSRNEERFRKKSSKRLNTTCLTESLVIKPSNKLRLLKWFRVKCTKPLYLE
ncbi:MAG: hypothetical protein KDC72_04040 [Bacteroidetes bacterium]|nr:hypothetical protein [Bacteroidota bacterium]